VTSKYKITKRAGKAMVHSEWMASATTVRRRTGGLGNGRTGHHSILGREFRAMVEGSKLVTQEPSTSGLT